jgi:hypothetical protein
MAGKVVKKERRGSRAAPRSYGKGFAAARLPLRQKLAQIVEPLRGFAPD